MIEVNTTTIEQPREISLTIDALAVLFGGLENQNLTVFGRLQLYLPIVLEVGVQDINPEPRETAVGAIPIIPEPSPSSASLPYAFDYTATLGLYVFITMFIFEVT